MEEEKRKEESQSEQPEQNETEEREQSPEEIREVLENARSGENFVNLTIDGLFVENIIIDNIEGDIAMLTFMDKEGNICEGIDVSINSITKIEIGEKIPVQARKWKEVEQKPEQADGGEKNYQKSGKI